MAVLLRMRRGVYDALHAHHLRPGAGVERLSYAFATSFVDSAGDTVVLVADPPILLGEDCYFRQSGGHVSLHHEVRDGVMVRFAASEHNTLVDIHDHWFAARNTRFSSIDDADDRARARYIFETLQPALARTETLGRARRLHTASIVLDQQGCDARLVERGGGFVPVDSIDLVGFTQASIIPNGALRAPASPDGTLARHDDFIGKRAAAAISSLRFGVIGCGGLGSIAAEGLYRLGARRFVLIDDDRLDPTNLNRWQGGRSRDVGAKKARLLARRLQSFGGGADVVVAPCSVLDPRAELALQRCDVLLGCVDNDVARDFLNRFAVQYLTPLFDGGVNIRGGDSVDFESRFYCVIPGESACVQCTSYELVDHRRLAIDVMDEVTSAARRDAGYVQEQPDIRSTPSAYSLNLGAASTLLTELSNWICGFRPAATCAYRSWRGAHEQRSDRTNHAERPGPACPVCGPLLGAGPSASLPRPLVSGGAARLLLEAEGGGDRRRRRRQTKENSHG